MSTIKAKVAQVANKVENSKVYKGFEKAAVTVGAGVTALGVMATPAFAAVTVPSTAANDILSSAETFINAGIPILLGISGLKLGIRFLRGSMH